jgi:hypothetical protein
LRNALTLVAHLLTWPGSSSVALSALRRDRETARRLARVARAAQAGIGILSSIASKTLVFVFGLIAF